MFEMLDWNLVAWHLYGDVPMIHINKTLLNGWYLRYLVISAPTPPPPPQKKKKNDNKKYKKQCFGFLYRGLNTFIFISAMHNQRQNFYVETANCLVLVSFLIFVEQTVNKYVL